MTVYKFLIFLIRFWIAIWMIFSFSVMFFAENVHASFNEMNFFDLIGRVIISAVSGGFFSFVALPLWVFRYLTDSPMYEEFSFTLINIASLILWVPLLTLLPFIIIGLVYLLIKRND